MRIHLDPERIVYVLPYEFGPRGWCWVIIPVKITLAVITGKSPILAFKQQKCISLDDFQKGGC